MSEPTDPARNVLDGTDAELALRYVKHRWRGPVEAARAGTLVLGDIDLDADWGELQRSVGVAALAAMAVEVLEGAALPDDARALRALAPELTPPAGRSLVVLFALNVAFRLRTDATLMALARSVERLADAIRPAPQVVGRLLARARSARAARGLVAGAGVAPEARTAIEAAIEPLPPPPAGARLHLEAEADPAVRALEAALRPREQVAWSRAGSGAQRLLLLRRTGGWSTLLAEDDAALERDLVARLARAGGVRRAAWSRFGPGGQADLLVHEGTRVVADRATLEAQVGAPPDVDDVAGALRALGVLDLDPAHPRGATPLRYAEHAGGGPPLGVERRLRKRAIRPLAFE